ncbi:hypothetical protein C8F04DRAFT_1352304 [Mycena alexandri]|uniref:Uncharacterized protein n=1 Tax=Mycena alexandri TaxID=1745969 RepID=A0AAD6SV08_9AGAR|nr:hypothetical protein C8F04DRAFT_1352304 [Mycena alexandri]
MRAATHPVSADLHFGAASNTSTGTRLNSQIVASSAAAPVAGPSRTAIVTARQTQRGVADMLPIIETSRSPPPSERSAASGGCGFFRTYQEQQPGSPRNGALTPDLNYAEIGHGRGAQHTPRRGEGLVPHHRPPLIEVDSSQSGVSAGSSSRSARPTAGSSSGQTSQTTTAASVAWPHVTREQLHPSAHDNRVGPRPPARGGWT